MPLLPNLSPSQFIVIRVLGVWAGGGARGATCAPKFLRPEKIILVTRQQFWGEILMFSLPVRAKCTVPPPQQDKARTPMIRVNKNSTGI